MAEIKKAHSTERTAPTRSGLPPPGLEAFAALVNSMTDTVVVISPDLRCRYVNDAVKALTGRGPEHFVGRSLGRAGIPPRVRAQWQAGLQKALESREPVDVEYDQPDAATSRHVHVVLIPRRDADGTLQDIVAVCRDVSRLERVQEASRRLTLEKQARAAAEQAADRMARLQNITAAMAEPLTASEVIDLLVAQILSSLPATGVAVALARDDGETLDIVRAEGHTPRIVASGGRMSGAWSLFAETARVGEPRFVEMPAGDRGHGRGEATIPLVVAGRILGALYVAFDGQAMPTADDRSFLVNLARLCAQALERVRLHELQHAARQSIERDAERSSRLQRVTAALSEAITGKDVAGVILRETLGAVHAQAGFIALSTHDGTTDLVGERSHPPELLQHYRRLPLDVHWPLSSAMRRQEPVWIGSRQDLQRIAPNLIPLAVDIEANACAVVPLAVEGRLLGSLALAFTAPQAFTAEDRAFVLAVARQAALTIDRARLYEAERRARASAEAAQRRLALQAEASAVLASSLDPKITLGHLARMLVPAVADWCEVDLLVPGDGLQTVALAHADAEKEERLREMRRLFPPTPRRSRGVFRALETGETQVWRVASPEAVLQGTVDPLHRRLLVECGIESCLAVPLMARERCLGVLTLASGNPARRFEAPDVELAEEIARRAASAIDNAQLYREAQASAERTRWHADRLNLLAEASRALVEATLDPRSALERLARHVAEGLGDGCVIRLAQDDGRLVTAAFHHGEHEAHEIGSRLWWSSDVTLAQRTLGEVVREGRPRLVPHCHLPPMRADDPPAQQAYQQQFTWSSLLAVPLIAHGRATGVLVVYRDVSDQPYTVEDQALLEDLASRASLATQNAELHRKAQESVRVRDEFLSIAGHELRTPLTALQLQFESLARTIDRQSEQQSDPGRVRSKITAAGRQLDRLSLLVNELLDVSRVTAGRLVLERQRMDLGELVREVAQRATDELARTGCTLRLSTEEGLVGLWDGARLDQIVTNLLSNAMKYGKGKPIELTAERVGSRARLSVRDAGIGIAEEDQARIFGRFERAVSTRHYGGFGLGLWIVRQIVEAHEGEIHVTSTSGTGSTFVVDLPLVPDARASADGGAAGERREVG